MALSYESTRGGQKGVTASQAILKGLAEDGGLFMPTEIPKLDKTLEQLAGMTYQETAYEVMKLFLTDYTEEELKSCIANAYDDKFDTEEIAPLAKADGAYFLELYHGSTIAFKDMALSILPHLMTTAAKKNHADKEIVILTATSGDTGKAAMAGFADVPGTRIIVFYPKGGVSKVQELQMRTQKGDNTSVVAIHGNFDDAQTGVKKLFGNKELEKEMAEKAVRLIHENLYTVYCHGDNIEARQNMQLAAFYAGRAFTRGCVGYVHAIGHTLGGLYGLPHGRAMGILLPHVMRLYGTTAHERLARLAEVCGMTGADDAEKANRFLAWIEQLKADMQIPRYIDPIRPQDEAQIIAWARKEANPLYPTPITWGQAEFKNALRVVQGIEG